MLGRTLPWFMVTFAVASPALARDPADPNAGVPPSGYSSIISGTKSYRPVPPLPWGDVNRRVTPKDAEPSAEPDQEGKAAPKSKDGKGGPHGKH